jgi:hypothetical protein
MRLRLRYSNYIIVRTADPTMENDTLNLSRFYSICEDGRTITAEEIDITPTFDDSRPFIRLHLKHGPATFNRL